MPSVVFLSPAAFAFFSARKAQQQHTIFGMLQRSLHCFIIPFDDENWNGLLLRVCSPSMPHSKRNRFIVVDCEQFCNCSLLPLLLLPFRFNSIGFDEILAINDSTNIETIDYTPLHPRQLHKLSFNVMKSIEPLAKVIRCAACAENTSLLKRSVCSRSRLPSCNIPT